MESSERNGTEAARDQQKPYSQCCGGDFTPFRAEASTSGDTESKAPCPMVKMCGGMMKGGTRGLGLLLLIPAVVLLSLGAAILLVPQVLTWLVAGGLIVVGVLVLVSAALVRRAAATG